MFGIDVIAFDKAYKKENVAKYNIHMADTLEKLVSCYDYIAIGRSSSNVRINNKFLSYMKG